MPEIKTKKIFPKSWRKRLGLKKSYDLDDLDDLLEDFLKGLWRWVRHRWRRRDRQERRDGGRALPDKDRLPQVGRPAARPAKPVRETAVSSALRQQYEQALTYQAEIRQLARQAQRGAARERMESIVEQVNWWMMTITNLIQRVDQLQHNELFQADRRRVPKAVAELEKRVEKEEEPLLRRELERALTSRRQQQKSLEKLHTTIRLAEIKVENTVSLLGTLYSQLLISESKGQVADYRHLLHEVGEEVAMLQDYLDALQEVKLERQGI